MLNLREAVTAVFSTEDKIFVIKRQDYLSVFPGYHAFPGGKVDKGESRTPFLSQVFKNLPEYLMRALAREINEELHYDLEEGVNKKDIQEIYEIGVAITPEFNPYRFKTIFYRIKVDQEISFDLDPDEAEYGMWVSPQDLLKQYERGEILAVPPTITLIRQLAEDINLKETKHLRLDYDPETEVPMIESIYGVRQLLPLSNTFPPANRTNCFLIGDEEKVLIDPSPKNEEELKKLVKSAEKIGFSSIFLTHHHPDHHEFAPEIARQFNLAIKMSQDTLQRIMVKWGSDYFGGIETQIMEEGDVLCQSLGGDVTLYAVPGHDEGQLALAPKNLNWMIVGDLIQTVGTVVIGGDEGDMGKYFSSLQKVIDLKPRFIIPSHGIAMGGTFKLERTLKHRKFREKQIIKLLDEGKSIDEMFDVIYEGLEERLRPYAIATIEAHLKKIQA